MNRHSNCVNIKTFKELGLISDTDKVIITIEKFNERLVSSCEKCEIAYKIKEMEKELLVMAEPKEIANDKNKSKAIKNLIKRIRGLGYKVKITEDKNVMTIFVKGKGFKNKIKYDKKKHTKTHLIKNLMITNEIIF